MRSPQSLLLDRPCVGLVLAAGFSRRFGSDKRRVEFANGHGLLARTLAQVRPAFSDLRVVLRGEDDATLLGVPEGVRIVRSAVSHQGMGASLAAGMRALIADSRADSAAILLGDMPWIDQATLLELCAQAGPERIVLPWYQGQRGQPVIFGRRFWPELARLEQDQGGKQVIAAHPLACIDWTVADAGILRDVDHPADLAPDPCRASNTQRA